MTKCFIACAILLYVGSCGSPPSCHTKQATIIVRMGAISDDQWEVELSVDSDVRGFSFCTVNMEGWEETSSMALLARLPRKTTILAAQVGRGNLCIVPTDGALFDLVLEAGAGYTITLITRFDEPVVRLDLAQCM